MRVTRGDIWLADLGTPAGSEAGFTRPVVIVQTDALNHSRLATYVAIPLTTTQAKASARWNLLLSARTTGLSRDSVAETNLIQTVPEVRMIERIGSLDDDRLNALLDRLDIALGRS